MDLLLSEMGIAADPDGPACLGMTNAAHQKTG